MTAVFVSQKSKSLVVKDTPRLATLFPQAPTLIEYDGGPYRVLPHALPETFLLRKMGLPVPSPMLSQYDWPGGMPPFDVQRKTCNSMTTERRSYVLNDMGTGKTKSALWAFDYLHGNGYAKKLLVVAKLSTVNTVWGREVFETIPHHKCISLHHRQKVKRLKALEDPDATIFVINHDGIGVILDELMAREDIDAICIDELAAFRNPSDRAKFMKRLTDRKCTQWVWGMTGRPMPNEPTDVWMQSQIVTPWTSPKRMSHCRDKLMYRVSEHIWKPKPDAVENAFKILQPAVRFQLDDVVELPELIERVVDVDMSDKQKVVYNQLAKHFQSMVDGKEITAMNAGAAMNKLLQVSSGWVYSNQYGTVDLEDTSRGDALIDIIMSTERKVLVFSPFKHTCAGISKLLTGDDPDHPIIEHAMVHGGVDARERDKIFSLFQRTDKYKVINAHPACMAHGLTLTAADTVVWWSPSMSLETFEQANARIRRVGQQHKQQVLFLQGTPIERKVYSLLRSKQRIQDQLLALFAEASE